MRRGRRGRWSTIRARLALRSRPNSSTGSLTFEVNADTGSVAIDDIVTSLADGAIVSATEEPATLGGYAASGDSVRGAIEALAAAYPLSISDDGAVLRIDGGAGGAIDPDGLGAQADDKPAGRGMRVRAPGDTLPDAIEISYYEPSRDYQTGLQRARRDGIGRRVQRIELAAAIEAGEAKLLADAALRRAWAQRARLSVRLPWRALATRAGQKVTLAGEPWRIAGWALERMVVMLDLVRDEAPGPAAAPASPGRAAASADDPAGATRLVLLDLPTLGDMPGEVPQLMIAAAGTEPGWRRAELSLSLDGGASWSGIGRTALPAAIGSAATILAGGPAEVFDRANRVEIELAHAGMTLAGADDAGLLAGINLAMLGNELIQFGQADQIGATRWRLGQLLRGRRGSEWAIATHTTGERFVLVEPGALRTVDLPLATLGAAVQVSAIGPGDDGVAVSAELAIAGEALRPPSPVKLSVVGLADSTIRIGWMRRSRAGWAWIDGADAPIGEDGERYRLRIQPAAGTARTVELTASTFDYGPAAQAEDGVEPATAITLSVVQIGTRAPSRAITLSL